MDQKDLAQKAMVQWLSHPSELGKSPARIECSNQFRYLDMTYYVFKFKRSLFDSKWMLGVCGGYEDNSTEHCGHVFSEFQEYNPQSEIDDAIRMIELVRQFWMQEARKYEKQIRSEE